MTLNRTLATMLAMLLALASPLSQAADAPAKPVPLANGDLAPDVLGKRLDGEKVLVSQFQGKVIVVSFWATWCGYCMKELPILEGMQKVAGRDNLEVIAVNTEDGDTFRRVSRKLKDWTMGLAFDPGKVGAKAYGVSGIPHLVIIGRDGHIVQVYRGYGEETLERIVADINGAIAATPAGAP
jgi:thiol-disulfide isomerase/thioredoxin